MLRLWLHHLRSNEDDLRSLGVLAKLCTELLRQAKFDEAEPLARRCLAGSEKLGPDLWNTFNRKSVLGGVLLGQAKNLLTSDPGAAATILTEAEPLLHTGYQGMKAREASIPASGKPRLPEALDRLVELYLALDKPEEAAKWRKEMEESKAAENLKPAENVPTR
jgi:hypothetical protein